jgi:tRNA threonylcarbamoyladenosine biosynthesis protein TsaB
MPFILHLETATEMCSVCISVGDKVLFLQESTVSYSHSKDITLLISECVKHAGLRLDRLDAVSVSSGPGSYTSLRVGVATAKGICYSLNKPLIAVETLPSIALATFNKEKKEVLYCPMIDARRMEVYCALFDANGQIVEPVNAVVINEESFERHFATGTRIIFSGNGAKKCKSVIDSPLAKFSEVVCSAKNIVKPALEAYGNKNFADLAYFAPNYMKAPQITIPKNKTFMNA